jgi:hypothetical protein
MTCRVPLVINNVSGKHATSIYTADVNSNLRTDAARYSETLTSKRRTIQCCNPGEHNLKIHHLLKTFTHIDKNFS